jgi:VCBS repeat-containing protein
LDSLSNAHVDLDQLSHRGHADAITVPDAHLLFSGDYHKSGSDLIISDDLHRVVVSNYFHGDKRPALVSPDGAPIDPKVIDALAGHTEYAQAGNAPAAKVVGHVAKMTGSASVVRNGVTIDVQNGDAVYQSDVVQTGSGSTLGLVLSDGTTFNLSAGARLMLNDLTYDASSTSNSALFTLVQGAASFVAGQVARTGDMKVGTPVATMGIRGTAVVLDIDAIDGRVSISVVDQHDGTVHAVQVFNAQGIQIGTVTSNGTSLTLTPAANFNVIAQESNKTPAQIAQEFIAFQAALDTYNVQKAIDPNLPQHTDNGGNNANPQQTKFASGSPPANSPYTESLSPTHTTTTPQHQDGGSTPQVVVLNLAPTGPSGTMQSPAAPNTLPPKQQVVEVATTPTPFVVTPPTVAPITSGAGNHTNPVMSASGDVVYDPDGIIYFYDRASGVTTRVTPAGDGFTYSGQTISSDGRYVAYHGTDGTHTYVYVWGTDPADVAHYHIQTQLVAGSSPAISGDGSTILVEQAGGSIGIYDLQGHAKGAITPASVGVTGALSKPAVSADGHVMAFWSSDSANSGGPEHLYSYNVSTGVVTEIASSISGGGVAPAATISADGHYVVYQSQAPGGHTEISMVDLATGQVVYSTGNAHEILAGDSKNPVISPDGHFIIFTSTAELTPGDTNTYADTYVVDVTNPAAPVYTLISEHGDAPSDSGVAISAGGLFVAFGSAASFYTGSTGGNIFVADPTSGRSAIIQETASSPDHLTASGVIGITGGSTGVTLTVTDRDGHPTDLLSAALSADGQSIQWNFSEAKSDFASLQYGQDLTQQFLITLNYPSGTTTVSVIVGVHDAVQPVVAHVDVAPVANPLALADGQENHSYVITPNVLLAHVGDIDGPSLSITDVSVKTGGGSLVHNEDGSWIYTPAEGFHGQVVFNYTASDGTLTSTSTASLDLVVPIDQPPVATPVTLPAGTEDASYTVSASSLLTGVTDPDGPSLSITSVSIASGGGNLVDNHDGTWTYTPAPGYAGPVNFNYTASDGTLSASSTANLTLAAETAIAPTLTVGANVTFVPTDGAAVETSLNLHAGDVVTFQWDFTTDDYLPYKDFAFASVDGAAFLLSDIQSTGSYGSTGWHTFSYTATADGTYNVGAGVMNDKDFAVLSYLAVDNIEVNGTVVQSFENGLAGSTALGNVSVVASAHSQVNANPILPTDGSMEAFLTSDPILESQIESFLGLAPGRLAGVGQSEGPEHTAIIVPITVSVAGNTHPDETYVTVSGAPVGAVFNHGVYNSEDHTWRIDAADLGGNLTITTAPGYFGSFTLSVTATSVVEGSHTSATTAPQTQVVTVDPVDPIATPVTLADGTEDTPYTIHASDLLAGASDPSGAPLSISAVDIAGGGGTIVDNHDGTWTYTPAQDYNGPVSFNYTTSDGTLTASSTASLTLAAVDDAPAFSASDLAPVYQTGSDPVVLAGNVSVSDVDNANFAGGSLTVTVTDGGHQGDTLIIAGDQHISLNGNTVMFDADGSGEGGAVAIGTLTDNINSLTIALNTHADDAAVAALSQAIEFENTTSNPDTGTRTVTFSLNDGGGTANGGQNTAFFTATVDVSHVINEGPQTASVADGGTFYAAGQFTVSDTPDAVTWRIDGGSPVASEDYQYAIDNFKAVKGSTTIFNDHFTGTAPPSGPNFLSGSTPAGGAYSDAGGTYVAGPTAALLEGSNATVVGTSLAPDHYDDAVFGQFTTLLTGTSFNSAPNHGLRSGQSFSVNGLFDLTTPEDSDSRYGIRLSDRVTAAGDNSQPGTETVDLGVVRNSDGTASVVLYELNYETGVRTLLDTATINPHAVDNEILLSLSNSADSNGLVHASFTLEKPNADGVEVADGAPVTLSAVGHIFDNEDWTRAQFYGLSTAAPSSSPQADSVLQGTYGTLDLAQNGTWQYFLNPGLPSVRALGPGETAHDDFQVTATATDGAHSSQTISINVSGPPLVTVTVQAPEGLDFQAHNALREMGAGTIQPGNATSFTILNSTDDREFVIDGSNFTFSDGQVSGGTITSFHEFKADGSTALADFTGLAVDAVSWIAAVQQAAAGDHSAIEALTSKYSYEFIGGTGSDSFGSAGHNDLLIGGAGDDTLDPGGAPASGHDTVTGGAGSDTIIYQAGYGALTITDFDQGNNPAVFNPNEADHIQLNGLTAPLSVSYTNGNAILDFGNNDIVTLLHVSQSQYEALGGSEFTNGNTGGNNGNGPVVSGADNTVAYTGTPVSLDQSVAVTDPTGTVTSVNVWILSGFQNGDSLSIDGRLDGDLFNPNDGSTIHYHYDNSAHGIYLATTSGTATLDDFDSALHLIQFWNAGSDPSAGGTDATRTVTWAAQDAAGATSPIATTTINVDDAPVIHFDNIGITKNGEGATTVAGLIGVTQNSQGTTTITGLSVTDADAAAAENLTLTATTAGATSGTTVSPASPSGHLSDINATLQSGLTYDQGPTPTPTDMVTLTVADGHGATDTVHLIFNVAQNPAEPVTLAGTTGKDVFFGTGYQDQFVFAAHSDHDTIMNFTPGQDHIDLSAVVTNSDVAGWMSQHVTVSPTNPSDALVSIDAADTIVLHGVSAASLTYHDFILHPGGGGGIS